MLAFPGGIVALGLLGFVFGQPVQRWYAPLALIISLSISWLLSKERRWMSCCLVLAIICVSIALSSLPVMFCVSDALNCYRVGVALMSEGWNPLFETEVVDIAKYGVGYNPWHVAYAFKVPFIYGAALCKALGYSCAGDSLNFILLSAASIGLYNWLITGVGLKRAGAILVSALLLFAPNVVRLLFGGKWDPALYGCLVLLIVGCEIYRGKGGLLWFCALALVAVLASGIKATGMTAFLAIIAVYLASGISERIARKDSESKSVTRFSLLLVVGLSLSVLFNPSPFITSAIRHGSPFYPMITKEGTEVPQSITHLTEDCDVMNDDARKLGCFGRYVRAYVSENVVDGLMAWKKGEAFYPDWPELVSPPSGYGAFFRVAFVLSIIGYFWVCNSVIKRMTIAIFVTTLLVPLKFIGLGHYVQQIYMIPILVGMGLLLRFNSRGGSIVFCCIGTLYCLIMSVPKLSCIPYIWLSSVQNLQIIEAVRQDPKAVISSKYYYGQYLWLHDSGLPVKVITQGQNPTIESALESYGPVARRYNYLREGSMPEGFYNYHFRDTGRQQIGRHDNAAAFFFKNFLGKEWRFFPTRIGQWGRYRGMQIHNAWVNE